LHESDKVVVENGKLRRAAVPYLPLPEIEKEEKPSV
jgi:hypothetical protein